MLLSKHDLEKYLKKKIYKIAPNTEICNDICEYNRNIYNVPREITSDFISLRTPLEEASEFILFTLLDSIEKITNDNSVIDKYFVDKEINFYKNTKLPDNKIKFPLKFKMIKITEDQWIGSIDFHTLMKFREAQLVNYNENAQRSLKRIVNGKTEYWQISINTTAIEKISELYLNEEYIPTPFTLNIPQESNSDFYYNEKENELVIKSLDHFDITDGYHRFLGACRACDENKNFNFTMELRITNFNEDKAAHFVHQEEQKTHMSKIDSNSMDMYNAANTTVKLLNESTRCHLQGLISRNKGIIKFGELADLVQYFYFKSVVSTSKKNTIKMLALKELIENFNMLAEYDLKYVEESYSYKQLLTVMFCFDYFKDKDKSNMCYVIDNVIQKLNEMKNVTFSAKQSKTSMINEVKKALMEVISYV